MIDADAKPDRDDFAMKCPNCGCPESRVRDTRNGRLRGRIVRFRECEHCKKVFRTVETVAVEG